MSIRRKQQNTFCFRLNCLGSTEVVQVAKAKSNNDG